MVDLFHFLFASRLKQSSSGFSLIELIVIIAVIGSIVTIAISAISNFEENARKASDMRNIQLWNNTYLHALAADPDFPDDNWQVASAALSNGFTAELGPISMNYQAPKPDFTHPGDPTFLPGTGITAAPAAP